MNFGRILANAFARRIAFVLVALLFAWLGIGNARAQSCPAPNYTGAVSGSYADQGMAYQACMLFAAAIEGKSYGGYIRHSATCIAHPTYYMLRTTMGNVNSTCAPNFNFGNTADVGSTSFPVAKTCAARPNNTSGFTPPSGSTQCVDGCESGVFYNGDGTSTSATTGNTCTTLDYDCPADFYKHPTVGNVCVPVELPECEPGVEEKAGVCVKENTCPEGMVEDQNGLCKNKDNECPPGNIKAPSGECLPGEGQCAAGEARRNDGTCGKDSNNDGIADDEDEDPENDSEEESFSGGDDCSSPPSCSGSPIDCGMARIQWRIDCNTRRNNNISGGACNAMPLCTGEKCNAMEYSSLLLQWRTTCALEKASGGEGGGDNQDLIDHLTAAKQAEVNALRALGQDDGHAGITEDDIWSSEEGEVPDSTLLGAGGGTCPLSFQLAGKTIAMSPQGWQIIAFIHWLFIAAAYLWVAVRLGS